MSRAEQVDYTYYGRKMLNSDASGMPLRLAHVTAAMAEASRSARAATMDMCPPSYASDVGEHPYYVELAEREGIAAALDAAALDAAAEPEPVRVPLASLRGTWKDDLEATGMDSVEYVRSLRGHPDEAVELPGCPECSVLAGHGDGFGVLCKQHGIAGDAAAEPELDVCPSCGGSEVISVRDTEVVTVFACTGCFATWAVDKYIAPTTA